MIGTTKWVHLGRARGGVDCGGLPMVAFAEAGLIEMFDTGHYSRDFMKHSDDQRFLRLVERFCRRVPDLEGRSERHIHGYPDKSQCYYGHPNTPDTLCLDLGEKRAPRAGDIALFQVGRCLAHCAIVDEWPRLIHADSEVENIDYMSMNEGWAAKCGGIWTFKDWT